MSVSPPSIAAEPAVRYLDRAEGETIAYCRREGQSPGPGLVWLSGFHSDMAGTKAVALDAWAGETGRACLRFDYFGHGQSSGAFADGTVGRWKDDCLAAIDGLTTGPQILVGSSMGGWMAALTALARPERIAGIVLIAPALDFTEDLMWANFSQEIRTQIETTGAWQRPSSYGDEPYPITKTLIEDGRSHLLLAGLADGETLPIACPVRILHGMEDADVPWRRSLDLCDRLASDDVRVTFVKSGDHRLSTNADIALLLRTVEDLSARIAG